MWVRRERVGGAYKVVFIPTVKYIFHSYAGLFLRNTDQLAFCLVCQFCFVLFLVLFLVVVVVVVGCVCVCVCGGGLFLFMSKPESQCYRTGKVKQLGGYFSD